MQPEVRPDETTKLTVVSAPISSDHSRDGATPAVATRSGSRNLLIASGLKRFRASIQLSHNTWKWRSAPLHQCGFDTVAVAEQGCDGWCCLRVGIDSLSPLVLGPYNTARHSIL